MRIAVIGTGSVGGTLGRRFAERGHDVVYGSRNPDGADEMTPPEAVARSEVVVLALPFGVVFDVIDSIGDATWSSRLVLDCTNPLRRTASGLTTEPGESGAARIQARLPDVPVYKVFNTTGYGNMADPVLEGRRAMMPFCGDDDTHRETVTGLVSDIGFQPIDIGGLDAAGLLESLAALWITMATRTALHRDFAFGILRRHPP